MFAILGLLLVGGVLLKLAPWALALWACVKAFRWVEGVIARRDAAQAAEAERIAALSARCWQQHAWVLEGDERGTYGVPEAA